MTSGRSRRLRNGQALTFSCLGKALVVGEQNTNLIANAEGSCEVERIQAAEADGAQGSGHIEHGVVQGQQGQAIEPRSRMPAVRGSVTSAGSNRLYREESAGYKTLPIRQLHKQGIVLVLVLLRGKLDVGRAVQISQRAGYSRPPRTSPSTSRLGGPEADGFVARRARARRSARGMVAPRSAASLAIGESAGPEGKAARPRDLARSP